MSVVGALSDNPSFDAPLTTEISHWEPRSFRLKATDSNITIRFAGIGVPGASGNGGDYIGLDDVSLRKVCFIGNAILNGCS